MGNMKTILYLAFTMVLVSFSRHDSNEIDGIWMGYYRTDESKEKVIVKFNAQDQMEFYTGGFDEHSMCMGSYKLVGDSISFTYKNPEGQEFYMSGNINSRKTYVDGTWKNDQELTGKFYLEKQKVQERIVVP